MAKGITREKIIDEAKSLIAENGLENFSLHSLADKLHIKPASLYSHVSGLEEILTGASEKILQEYHDSLKNSIQGRERKEALLALAEAERDYARENPEFYELIMNLQLSENQELKDAAEIIVEPVLKILDQYHLTAGQKTNAERAFRACVYGFISQEKHGYFSHFPEDIQMSFRFAVSAVAEKIEAMDRED